MKIMKNIFYFFCAAFFSAPLFSQTENVTLPDITTTVSGEVVTAGKDALPDFSKIVPNDKKDDSVLPVFAEENVTFDEEPVADFSFGEAKSIFAQGLVGGGFPGDFIGDFSVYKSIGENPFKIEFSHLSKNGYGKHKAGDGFFDSKTRLFAEKTITAKNTDFIIGGEYKKNETGLQSASPFFYDLNSQEAFGNFSVRKNFSHGFEFESKTGGSWYNRYAGIADGENDFLKQEKNIDVVYLNQNLNFFWSGKNFFIDLNGRLDYGTLAGKFDSVEIENIFRAEASASAGWKNDFLEISASGGIAGGNEMGTKNSIPFFDAGISFAGKDSPLKNTFSFEVRGGLDTYLNSLSELENKYKFSKLFSLPSETSDWFVNAKISVPVSKFASIYSSAEFRKTAFENGTWEAAYDSKTTSGIFEIASSDRTLFSTDSGFSYLWNVFTLSAGWKSHWIHVPSDEFKNYISTSVSFDSKEKSWGFSISLQEDIDSDSDKCPLLGGEVYYNVKDSIKLSFELSDAIKLFAGKDREFMGTDYLVRAGCASLFAKFYF